MKRIKAPVNVSPTIRFARWSFLFMGMFYGWSKRAALETLEKREGVLRREAVERRLQREKEITKKTYRELLMLFGELVGVEFPPDWEPPE